MWLYFPRDGTSLAYGPIVKETPAAIKKIGGGEAIETWKITDNTDNGKQLKI